MMDLRKTNYLLLIINVILILFLISGFLYFGFNLNSKSIVKQSFNSGDLQLQRVDTEIDIEAYKAKHDKLSSVVESGNLKSCEGLDESFVLKCKDSIYLNQATEYSSVDICENITMESMKIVCRELVSFN